MTTRESLLPVTLALLCSCSETGKAPLSPAGVEAAAPTRPTTSLRSTGIVQALESFSIRAPQITGQSGRMTLTYLIANGTKVSQDQVIAEFDRTAIQDEARETEAKLAETGHQLEEKRAQIRSDRAKRTATIYEAKAELQKAQLQLRRGPVISEIDRLKNEARAASSSTRVLSLEKSSGFRNEAEDASLSPTFAVEPI
jgi:multidrug efflux pump subunit AcrA (membrane-fusion protein)